MKFTILLTILMSACFCLNISAQRLTNNAVPSLVDISNEIKPANKKVSVGDVKNVEESFRVAPQAIEHAPLAVGVCDLGNNIEVEATGGTNASYATLGAAFTAINAGTHTGVITIDVCGDTTEAATATLNASGAGSAVYTSISMAPAGGAARTISGSIAGEGMILLNGADNVTIDGLNTAGNSLTISNTSAAATSATSTVRFIGGATGNTITRASVLGSATMALATNGGNIFFSTDAVTANGNDNNTISNCNIGPAGANLPTKLIYGNGSVTTAAIRNSGIVINNNNLFDFFSATVSVSGIHILSGNDNWTISNNRIYQTAARTFTGTVLRYAGITLNSTTAGLQGAFTVTGNVIGFGAANGTGTTTISGSTNVVRGIDAISVSTTTPTSIQGNTISGINQTTASTGTGTTTSFIGMILGSTGGRFDVGTVTGNNIGSLDGSSTIAITVNANGGTVYAIYDFSVTANTISNNNIGAITIQGTGTTSGFRGIQVNTATGLTATLTANVIGGTNAAGAITNTQVGAYSIYGIQISSSNVTATRNIIRNLNGNSNTANGIVSSGIITSGSTGVNTISQNIVQLLSNNSGAASNSIYGIYCSFPATANLVSRNLVRSLSVNSTTLTSQMVGLLPVAGSGTYQNNMVSLGSDTAGAPITTGYIIYGIFEIAGVNNIFNNSSYITGTGVTASTSNSFAFVTNVASGTRSYLDNIFYNGRSNAVAGGALHVAIGLNTSTAGLTSNYNDLYAPGTDAVVGTFNGTAYPTLAAYQTGTGQEANSLSVDPQFVLPLDLHLKMTSPMINAGIVTPFTAGPETSIIAAVADDFDGQARDAQPDIGADEFMAPTAAAVSVSGRVLSSGKGLANARVELVGAGGKSRTVTTNMFGNFTFTDVESGSTYVVNVSAKKYTFAPQVVSLTDSVTDLTFTAQ